MITLDKLEKAINLQINSMYSINYITFCYIETKIVGI